MEFVGTRASVRPGATPRAEYSGIAQSFGVSSRVDDARFFPPINFKREVTVGHMLLDVNAPTGALAKVNLPIRPREDV